MMKIQTIELFHIRLPLLFTFKTSKSAMRHRDTIVVKSTDELGNVGFGEVVSFDEPFYTQETLHVSTRILVEQYIPYILQNAILHPFDIHRFFKPEYPMALAGFENSLADAYAKRNHLPIMKLLFDETLQSEIPSGVVLGDLETPALLVEIEKYLAEGTSRIKLKISPQTAIEKMIAVRKRFPSLALLADANQSFSLQDLPILQALDQFDLLCIEEPLLSGDIHEYQAIQTKIRTPICLDESILSLEQLEKAIALQAFQVLNVKTGRLGGLFYAKKMIESCRMHGIRYWIGSMLESGISKILHVHLASLSDTWIPGDLSSSNRYFSEDLIAPEIVAKEGKIPVPQGVGLGVEINEDALSRYAMKHIKFQA